MSSSYTKSDSVDPVRLRKAVRLVHCLQKERGASCAYSVNPYLFRNQLAHAQRQTDTALRLWGTNEGRFNESLSSVRIHVMQDWEYDDYNEEGNYDNHHSHSIKNVDRSVGEYHRVLVLFNSMISSLLHMYLITTEKKSSTLTGHRKGKRQPDMKRSSSEGLFGRLLESAPPQELLSLEEKSQFSRIHEHKHVNFASISQTPALLNLLECFVALKESTGLERALLSSMFALGSVDHRLLNDLVLEVENQFKLISELKNLKDLDVNVLSLVRENVGLPPPMERLQSFILSEFDLAGFQQEMNPKDVWNLITVYMDKLHSLELLIIEELECSISEDHESNPNLSAEKESSSKILHKAFATNGRIQQLEDMPAERVKSKVLEIMTTTPSGRLMEDHDNKSLSVDDNPVSEGPQATNKPDPSEWDIGLYEIHFQKRIGRGTAGTTYLARWSGQPVAVKVAAVTDMGLDGWKTEVKSLRKLHHPNIIRLLGSVYNESPLTYCLVLEYCSGGDLHIALKKHTHGQFFRKVSSDIAHGMAYLHNRGIIHRDIKPANVLIDGDVSTSSFTAKVTDFGVAATEFKQEMTSETGTYRWMAPEVIRHHPYSEKADCYSFGIVLWQLITREDPFPNHSPLEAAGKVALELARPDFPESIPPSLKCLIEGCWAEDPDWRYPFDEIVKKLEPSGELQLSMEESKWLQAPLGHPVYNRSILTESMNEDHSLVSKNDGDQEAAIPSLDAYPSNARHMVVIEDKRKRFWNVWDGKRKRLERKLSRDLA